MSTIVSDIFDHVLLSSSKEENVLIKLSYLLDISRSIYRIYMLFLNPADLATSLSGLRIPAMTCLRITSLWLLVKYWSGVS